MTSPEFRNQIITYARALRALIKKLDAQVTDDHATGKITDPEFVAAINQTQAFEDRYIQVLNYLDNTTTAEVDQALQSVTAGIKNVQSVVDAIGRLNHIIDVGAAAVTAITALVTFATAPSLGAAGSLGQAVQTLVTAINSNARQSECQYLMSNP